MREDVVILDKLVKRRIVTLDQAKELTKLPLLIIPDGIRKLYTDQSLAYWESSPLEEFCVFMPGQYDDILFYLKIVDGLLQEVSVASNMIPGCYAKAKTGVDNNILVFDPDRVEVMNSMPYNKQKLAKGFSKVFGHVLAYTQSFFNDCHNQDLYAVGVSKPKEKKSGTLSRKQLISRVSGPSVIFLNKLPQPSTSTGTSTEEPSHTKAPHHRRGHFKTLRDPRFSKHPKYLVERGIYVKPQWIGDRESIVNGTTYTVLER